MGITRRGVLAGLAAARTMVKGQEGAMYGLIGRMKAVAGKRDELAAILMAGTGEMPGCLSYVVAHDPADADALWITEVWEDEGKHKASLQLPAVREAIAKGRPLIASFDAHHVTRPVGGFGLQGAQRG
jgi:quinol monooxygenase YgiN